MGNLINKFFKMMKQSWSKAEHAIKQRQEREWHEQKYTAYSNELNAVQRNTEWHETFTKYEVGKRNAQMDKMVEKECVQANVELKTLRQKRLKEEYAKDWAQWEEELNGLGLAILKDRLLR